METTAYRNWEITPAKVESAVQRIIEVGRPRKIILFGSYTRSDAHNCSDVDFLIVTRDEVENPRQESIRIRRALRGISMPMDIIVVPEAAWLHLKDRPGMIYREALRKGKIVYES